MEDLSGAAYTDTVKEAGRETLRHSAQRNALPFLPFQPHARRNGG
ncbi:hypothetical protein AOR01nite_04140 [Acetobacter orleanensis]|uniref:Uncharacterized protein n=1 Tax=Acetobacter orleanensis TaxID=104099 RepID=A0A4Y3TLQ7_9PROT|nr:hypothetical protein Abol_014_190 [Acetobacter orleanensis JCM 7639]GEB81937.1 hypothetical protein AOR01nite_04140 [Acetobacter orleanensis]